jgi:polyhydroxybutyrate depolymerase
MSACAPDIPGATLKDTETGRPYKVYAPKSKDPAEPLPVLVVLHAYRTDPNNLVKGYSLIDRAVRKKGWILVVPEGQKDDAGDYFWNATKACCSDNASQKPDEVKYLNNMMQNVMKQYPVNAKRVYVFGVSNGAFMAYRWACSPKSHVSSIVAIAGAGPFEPEEKCDPQKKVNVFHIHGKKDEVIRYDGKYPYPSTRQTVERWIQRNELPSKPTQSKTPYMFGLGVVDQETWKNESHKVELWTVRSGDHHMRWLRWHVSRFIDFFQDE